MTSRISDRWMTPSPSESYNVKTLNCQRKNQIAIFFFEFGRELNPNEQRTYQRSLSANDPLERADMANTISCEYVYPIKCLSLICWILLAYNEVDVIDSHLLSFCSSIYEP